MPRNQSFSMTTLQYVAKSKTVTRRLGWWDIEPGEILSGVEKAQGLKRGEKIKRLGQHRVLSARGEPLRRMTDCLEYGMLEVVLEGFPDMTPGEFVEMFCWKNKCTPDRVVNRIEFEYV